MTWEKEPRCIAVLEPVERQTAHLVFDSKVMDSLHWILNFRHDKHIGLILKSVICFQGIILECDQQLAYLHGYSSSDELVNMNVKQLIPSLVLPTSGQVIDKVRNSLQAWVTLQNVVVMIALYLVL